MEESFLRSNLMLRKSGNPLISLPSYIFMKNQLHVRLKADLSFNLRHIWPMKSFRRPRFFRKTDWHFKISDAVLIHKLRWGTLYDISDQFWSMSQNKILLYGRAVKSNFKKIAHRAKKKVLSPFSQEDMMVFFQGQRI